MAKRKSSFKSKRLPSLQKATMTALIALLSYTFYHLTQQAIPPKIELPSSNEPAALYSNQAGDDLTYLYVNAIQDAKKSVTLIIYALMDPRVIQALRDKTAQGIPVYIVCDAKASPGITQKLPQAHIVRRAGQGLTHQKILIIDESQVLVGSANLTTDSLEKHGNIVAAFDNPALAEVLTIKAKSMTEGDESERVLHQVTRAGDQHLEFWVLPDDNQAAQRVIDLLRSAQKTIRVAMFTWTRKDFAEEIIKAKIRGVKIEIVMDRYAGKGAGAKIFKILSDAGIPVRLSTGKGLLHYKFAYIDDQILISGSANWTLSAFKFNDDCFIVLYPLNSAQQAKMRQAWSTIMLESEIPK
jgi:phosphatidylserine/phosphatidylglycerophosphate/cardiolipin synthase-like enzyme